ncbi:hypothetical protein HRJ34_18005 [Rhizorhabdus wittichii]|uniref:Uncharacterized protein n=1 Tax=Rhizorhabdus wittichii TaxID=160791 RepID=A0A975D044_9SPHN|nr:hypothetical protein [Rhizorhabdus wittichii]QTH20228.1 hypothetical protein HRJ34_18005 [Rhizorhabdus wittichii]
MKKDYEPLLSAGRHEMTIGDFETQFVVGLGGSSRSTIWQEFKTSVLQPLKQYQIPCELWLDGSFITKCPEPDDIDGSLMVLSEVIDNLDEDAFSYLKKFDDYNPGFDKCLDLFLCQLYPKAHPLHGGDNDPDGWAWQWSRERNSSWLKGFVVIPFR